MEVIKYSVDYYGYYGGSIHEYCLLPIESAGVYIDYEEGTHEGVVYLGEIEGKHSEVYGDLTVEVIDLSTLNQLEINTLIKGSDISNFESFFESAEESFSEFVEEIECEGLKEEIGIRQRALELAYELEFSSWSIKMGLLSESFVVELLKARASQLVNFSIKKEDEEKFIQVMNDYELEFFG